MRRGISAAAFVVAVLSCSSIPADELACEEALAHLTECCPAVDARAFQCGAESGCSERRIDLQGATADCLRSASCERYQRQGTCERARLAVTTSNMSLLGGSCP